jgi:isopentenyl phosphate kinase
MYIKKQKNKIVGFASSIPKVYEEKKKKYIDDNSFEKIDEKSKELQDFLNQTGKYEVEKKPAYDLNKMWDILEAEIPALKKYRKSVRGE